MREFGLVLLVDTAGIDPKVCQTILSGLFSTEPDLLIARLVLASAIYDVIEGTSLSGPHVCESIA